MTTATLVVDYGDEIPLNFMDVNYTYAIILITGQVLAAVVGTFGNLLILVAVATHRHLRSVETIFIVYLACYDLYITMFAQPLSVLAKVIGWRSFEGIPGVCSVIGYFCTVSCIGSCLTLSVMSLNRYVLICHHTMYTKIFTVRNSFIICILIFLFGVFLITFNFYGIGDHSFDYKSFECIWDRMATYGFTIFFGTVLGWLPMTISGLAYGRTYWYVHKVRKTVSKRLGIRPAEKVHDTYPKAMNDKTWSTADRSDSELLGSSIGDHQQKQGKTPNPVKSSMRQGDELLRNQVHPLKGNSVDPGVRPRKETLCENSQEKESEASARAATTTAHGGMKLAKPLFIIYVAFTMCWMPYSLSVTIDEKNKFPREVHAFITAFAHANSSINWIVYYHTHSKMRQVFRSLLSRPKKQVSMVPPISTIMTLSTKYSRQ